jgi:hypothetical protein
MVNILNTCNRQYTTFVSCTYNSHLLGCQESKKQLLSKCDRDFFDSNNEVLQVALTTIQLKIPAPHSHPKGSLGSRNLPYLRVSPSSLSKIRVNYTHFHEESIPRVTCVYFTFTWVPDLWGSLLTFNLTVGHGEVATHPWYFHHFEWGLFMVLYI